MKTFVSCHLFIIVLPCYVSFFLSALKISHVFQQFDNDVHRCDFLCICLFFFFLQFVSVHCLCFLIKLGNFSTFISSHFSALVALPLLLDSSCTG